MTTIETPPPAFLTVPETAGFLRVSRPTVYRRIADGTLPAVRIGRVGEAAGALRVPRAALERWLKANETGRNTR